MKLKKEIKEKINNARCLSEIRRNGGPSPRILTKINNGDKVTMFTLGKFTSGYNKVFGKSNKITDLFE